MKFARLDPACAYIGASLFLPKAHVAEGPIRGALTFGLDKENNPRVLVQEHPAHWEVPRGFLTKTQIETDLGLTLVDLRPTKFEQISLRLKPGRALRDDAQRQAWAILETANDGVLNLKCGGGKTFLAYLKAAARGFPTLIVSPQKAHLDNWETELYEHFEIDTPPGRMQGKRMECDREVVLCTVQTLAKRVDDGGLPANFSHRFGTIIFDETHHLSAQHFVKAIDMCIGYRLGLTATVERINRDEGIFLSHLGPVMFRDLSQDLIPDFEIHDTGTVLSDEELKDAKDVTGEVHLGKLRKVLGQNEDRNDRILSQVLKDYQAGRRGIYVLTHSPEHAHLLSSLCPVPNGCISGMVKDGRLDQLNDYPIVFATMGVAAEAYNRADLDTLHLTTPFAAHGDIAPAFQQAVGRTQRPKPGKKNPLVHLWRDEQIEECRGLIASLIKYAQEKGFNIKGGQWTKRARPKGW